MAVAVIDRLEAVKVQEQQPEAGRLATLWRSQQLAQMFEQRMPVVQAGQLVVQRQMLDRQPFLHMDLQVAQQQDREGGTAPQHQGGDQRLPAILGDGALDRLEQGRLAQSQHDCDRVFRQPLPLEQALDPVERRDLGEIARAPQALADEGPIGIHGLAELVFQVLVARQQGAVLAVDRDRVVRGQGQLVQRLLEVVGCHRQHHDALELSVLPDRMAELQAPLSRHATEHRPADEELRLPRVEMDLEMLAVTEVDLVHEPQARVFEIAVGADHADLQHRPGRQLARDLRDLLVEGRARVLFVVVDQLQRRQFDVEKQHRDHFGSRAVDLRRPQLGLVQGFPAQLIGRRDQIPPVQACQQQQGANRQRDDPDQPAAVSPHGRIPVRFLLWWKKRHRFSAWMGAGAVFLAGG